MTPTQLGQIILQEMNAITRMERGQLCSQSPAQGAAPFYKLQCWHHGTNHTRYVPAAEVVAVRQALAAHQCFQTLTEEFVELTATMTRQEQAADAPRTPGSPGSALPGNRSLPEALPKAPGTELRHTYAGAPPERSSEAARWQKARAESTLN